MRDELLNGLTEEQIKKVRDCKDSSEVLALAKEEGIQLTDEQLEAVSGGGCLGTIKCKKCGSKDIDTYTLKCRKCGHRWEKG